MSSSPLDKATGEVRDAMGTDIYVFASSESRHFLAEAALLAAAGVVLEAFFKGVSAGLQGRVEAWGKQAGKWLGDRMEGIFRGDATTVQADLKNSLTETREQFHGTTNASVAVQQSQSILEAVLIDCGLTPQAAQEAAHRIASAGRDALQ